ncbi:MAG: hypothetical protein JWR51_4687 [Devosia sp.]|uniref:hypothetical protein n=1 Tax=Devosia sp. TaxID=1871048 RepID=UPI002610F784|nr:hypothetical protein [Devosia sp.]MDB5531584.1 hypothetical protein [Devosia sp.]
MSEAPEPVEVFSLAQYLGEEMDERGWTSWDVAARMGGKDLSLDALTVDILLAVQGVPREKVVIGADMYRQLERAFGVSEGFLEALNAAWERYPDRRAAFEAPEDLFSGGFVATP